jgi:hypothetical protein
VSGQEALFSVPAAPAPAGTRRHRAAGVRWRQRQGAGQDDCAACWAAQQAAAAAGRPVLRRRRATWVREEDRDAGRRSYHAGRGGVTRTAWCPPHKAERQLADALVTSPAKGTTGHGGA